ncbi:MAG: 2OG-Fe(II) oxygenase [Actinomycetota bacterium]|nr:2OG-Fe(II) oxygenase [Actinomycetota bacterium]
MEHFTFGELDDASVMGLAEQFRRAVPFPHVVLDGVVRGSAADVVPSFPDPTWSGWSSLGDSYQRGKRVCRDIDVMPALPRAMLAELAAPAFLSFLERVSGIARLLPDPYLEGGGLHCTTAGGRLSRHTDFHLYPRLGLFRQINVLVYLNPGWRPSDGGQLHLYRAGEATPAVTVDPEYGRCVIFRTDDASEHAVEPLSEAAPPRRSLATYYYTSAESDRFSGDTHTHWREHDEAKLTSRGRARLLAYRGLVQLSRVFSVTAYRVNPHRDRR